MCKDLHNLSQPITFGTYLNAKAMKNQFDLKSYMTAKREIVINAHVKASQSQFFNGVTLRDFMIDVYNQMALNSPKSEKRADSIIDFVVSNVVVKHTKVHANDSVTDALKAKYNGTAFMALV